MSQENGGPIEPEVIDGDARQLEVIDDATAIDPHERALIDMQVATAKRYPRSITQFRKTLKEYVTATPKIAEKMYYSLPRGKNKDGSKKFVEGPSVRLAEAALAAWKNTRSGGRTGLADATHVQSQGFCHDLENNNYVAFEVRRRITGEGGRFNEDMITVTGAAASKIAWRNAIFGVIPRVFINEGEQLARACAAGALKSIDQARKDALEWWAGLASTTKPEQLLAILGKPGIDDVTVDDLLRLKGLRTAIEDGETTVADLLAELKGAGRPQATTPDPLLQKAAPAEAAPEHPADAAGAEKEPPTIVHPPVTPAAKPDPEPEGKGPFAKAVAAVTGRHSTQKTLEE
jgi:hypothetical protein